MHSQAVAVRALVLGSILRQVAAVMSVLGGTFIWDVIVFQLEAQEVVRQAKKTMQVRKVTEIFYKMSSLCWISAVCACREELGWHL